MPDAVPRKRLTIRDLKPIERIPAPAQPPRLPPRPVQPPAASLADIWPSPPPSSSQEAREAAAQAAELKRARAGLRKLKTKPPRPPGEPTEAQRAKTMRHRQRWRQKRALALRPLAEQLLLQLQARWPVAFARGWPRPLVRGVHREILAETGCDVRVLRIAMGFWCSRAAYLVNTVDMTHRHGLDGEPVIELTGEERAEAKARLAKLKQRTPR